MQFKGTKVLITGGSSGIGLALAKEFAAREASIYICSRNQERLDQALKELAPIGGVEKAGFVCDVVNPVQVDRLAADINRSIGVPDILINSAGVAHPGTFQELDQEYFVWQMETNYYGSVNTTRAFLPAMIARGSGHIINIGSLASYIGLYGYTAYGASKFAVRGFSEALRMELKPLGIRVSLVIPPDTDTPQLAYENQHKPLLLKYLLPEMGVITPDMVASAVIRGIQRDQFEIVPDFGSKAILFAIRLFGPGGFNILDWLLRRAEQRIKRENGQHIQAK